MASIRTLQRLGRAVVALERAKRDVERWRSWRMEAQLTQAMRRQIEAAEEYAQALHAADLEDQRAAAMKPKGKHRPPSDERGLTSP